MNIVVAGLGYVGSSLAIMLAHHHHVTAVDILPHKAEQINCKQAPIVDTAMQDALSNDSLDLSATTEPERAFHDADFLIIATPTDYNEEEATFNTSSVESVAEQAIQAGTKATIVVKSTVPIGFTRQLQNRFNDYIVLYCPEFLREGRAYADTLAPERIIVGANDSDSNSGQVAKEFAHLLVECSESNENIPVRIMNYEEAESVKLFANTYLAMRVAFFNELDLFAEERHLDSRKIIEAVCMDSRIGNFYNNPSFGYGGYCLPKDTRQLLSNYENLPSEMIQATIAANFVRKESIAKRIIDYGKDNIVGVYLLSMKAQSDNFRNSSILDIMRILQEEGMNLIVYDPILANEEWFNGFPVENDLARFKLKCDIILANRYDSVLDDVAEKVYTRDIFHNN